MKRVHFDERCDVRVSFSPLGVPVARLAAAQGALTHDTETAYFPAGG